MPVRYLLSLSVRPSVTSRYCIETTGAGFWCGGFLAVVSDCLVRKFGYLQEVRVLFSGTLSQTLDLENFAMASQSHCRQNSSTVELVDDTCTTVDESWLFTTRRSTAICCGFVVLLFVAFSALTLLAGRQEEHPACTNRVMRCWCGYLSGARCR